MAYAEITWPGSLPQCPLEAGYCETPDYDVIVTETDAGPKRQRRRSSATPESRVAKYLLDAGQRRTFKSFLEANAGRSFWWPDPTENGELCYVRVKGGSEVQIVPAGPLHWYVTFTLEVWPYVRRH